MKGERFEPMEFNEETGQHKSNVLDGEDVVIYRNSTRAGQYRPLKYAIGRPQMMAIHSDRIEFTATSFDEENITVALSSELIRRLSEYLEEEQA